MCVQWTYAPSLRARPPQYFSHAQPAGLIPTALRARRNHPGRVIALTPAGELGLDPGPSDYTAAAWNAPHETIAADAMDSDEDLLTVHDDTVYDNAYGTDDNVYDVYHAVHD